MEILDCLDELKRQQEKLNAAQAILFKEVQCVRKGMALILRDLIGAEKCESMQL